MDVLKVLIDAVKKEKETFCHAIVPANYKPDYLGPPEVPDWSAPLSIIIATGDEGGDTPLHLAVTHNHQPVVQYLLCEVKCSPHVTNSKGQNALHLAAKHGHVHLLTMLVDALKDDGEQHDAAMKSIKHLASPGDSSFPKPAVSPVGSPESPVSPSVNTAAMAQESCMGNCDASSSTPKLSTDHYASVSSQDNSGNTPLHLAATHNHQPVVQYLLCEVKCSPHATNSDGQNVFHLAAKHGHFSILKVLVEAIGDDGEQHQAANKNETEPRQTNSELQNSLLPEDAYPTITSSGDNNGNTPLHLAAAHGHQHIVHYLVHEAHCNPHLTNGEGQIALHLAAKQGHIALVKYLIQEENCALMPMDDLGQTPLYLAAGNGQLDVVKYFALEKQCDVSFATVRKETCTVASSSGRTPLHIASRNGHMNVVRFLVEQLYCTDEDGTSPLHLACQQGHTEIVKYFIEDQQVSPASSRLDGCTPLHLAALGGHIEVVRYLVERKNCNPICTDKYGNTPLFWAELGGSLDVIEYLNLVGKESSTKADHKDKTHPLCNANRGILKYLIQEDFSPPDGKGVSPLHIASRNGHQDLVEYLVNKRKCDPSCKDKDGNTPLHNAALGGNLNTVRYFIGEKQCRPMVKGHSGKTALHFASQEGYLNIVKYLVDEHRVDPSYPDNRGATPLHMASKNDHLEIVRYLVEEKKCSPMYRNKEGDTPLHYAASEGSMSVLKYFITEKNCNAMEGGNDGETPLYKASSNGRLSVVKYLIDEEQADPFVSEDDGFTPLHVASINGHLNVVKYLVEGKQCDPLLISLQVTPEHLQFAVDVVEGKMRITLKEFVLKRPRTPLHCASANHQLPIAKYLIDNLQINPSYPDEDGATPLHMASATGHTEMVKYLVEEKQCDPMLRNKKGNTSLNMAAAHGNVSIFKYLVDQKHCNPMEGGWKGRTPLHDASQEGHLHVVIYLVEEGLFNPSTPDDEGITPLHLASAQGHLEIVKFFVEQKQCKPLNYQDSNGKTPVDRAVLAGSWRVVLYFAVHKYCNPSQKDQKGRTALHYFSMEGCLDSVKQLVDELKANPSCPDNDGITPLHLASANGHLAIVKYFLEEKSCDLLYRDSDGDAALSFATYGGSLDVVKYLISEKKCNPTEKNNKGGTPLHYACMNGHMSVVKYFVDELKVSPMSKDNNDITLLHLAARKGNQEVVSYLVKKANCDPLYCDGIGLTPHKLAAMNGQWDVVLFFARERKCDPLVSDSEGRTILHHFTGAGKLETVKQIVDELQADPSTPDNEGNVPLHVASVKGNLDIIKYLVEEKQCDPIIRKKNGNTSLNLATLNGHLNILQYFVHERHCNPTEGGWRGKTPLHDASQEGHLNIVRYLVEEEGVEPSCTDAENSTPLHSASYNGHLQVVQYLIQKHCHPMQEDKDGNTPLKKAASRKQWGVVMYFVTGGYCTSNERGEGVRMFRQACSDGRLDVMNCLVQKLQVDPSIPNDDGITPLHIASTKGHLSMVKYLVECKCSPLCKEKDGNTPMNYAALGGHLNVLHYFITEKKCSPTTKGWHGRTVLHDASQRGHLHVVKYLADMQPVDPSCKDNNGLTPLHTACSGGHMGVVKYLVSQKYCDPSISQPQVPSPIELAFVSGNIEIAVYLVGKCTVAPSSNELLKAALKLFPVLSPSVKVYIIGYRSSGKSTLTKALQDEDSQFTGRFLNVSGVTAGTAGIDPVQFNSKWCGKITLYDFAGHKEYYGSHEALFESTSHPVFLIAVDLRLADEEILKTLKYWISLASKGVTCAQSQADIILVGSHADVLKTKELKAKRVLLAEFVRTSRELNFENVECVGWAELDCRKSASDGMSKLRQLLEQSCRLARFRADYNNTNAILLLKFLTERYIGRRKACTFSQLFDALLHEEMEVFNTLKHPLRLCEACESLNTSGDIVFLKNQENMEDSWIVLEKEHILSEVQGILKAIKSLTSTGLVTWSLLHTKTEEPSLVVEYMLKMEFCSEINRHSFKQIKGAIEPKKGERYFFFPDLTMEKRPKDVWQHYDQLTYSFGWILKCSQTDCTNFFTPRFLQVLLVRLTCRFALTPRPDSPTGVVDSSPGCRIWMNGISWKDTMLMVEVLVEVIQQNSAVVVLLKCQQEATEEMEYFKLRSSLIQEVRSVKSKHCPSLETTESLILPDHIQQYPLQSFPELPISAVAKAIATKHRGIIHPDTRNFLLLKELLLFDPFENFGVALLQKLSSYYQKSREVKVQESVLDTLSIAAVEAWQKLAVILQVGPDIISKVQIDPTKTEIEKCRSILDHWSSSRKNTYSDLCKQLSSYSIFSGMVWMIISRIYLLIVYAYTS